MDPLQKQKASNLQGLSQIVRRHTEATKDASSFTTAIEGLLLLRSDPAEQSEQCIIKPALCITVQGEKRAMFGDQRYEYRTGQALVVTVDMPSCGTVYAASRTEPYLGLVIELDLQILQALVEETGAEVKLRARSQVSGAFTLDLDHELMDCALRAMRLLEKPTAISTLYPGIMREICYWLLTGPGGGNIHQIMRMANGHDGRVMRAIQRLRTKFRETVHIEELAHAAHMSPTTFHRQFKSVTSMAPLQYQKQLRLLEARRLMITSGTTVETAAFEVGYASASHFSREYTRMFGSSPRRDVSVWKATIRPSGKPTQATSQPG